MTDRPGPLKRAFGRVDRARTLSRHLGVEGGILWKLSEFRCRRLGARRPFRLRTPLADHDLLCRPRTTDPTVFRRIFIEGMFSFLQGLPEIGLILDCGAYTGYSTVWLLGTFPGSRAIAIEPHPETYEVLRRNLAPYGPRATALRAGVWSHSTGLRIEEEPFRRGGEWTRQVRETRPGEAADFPGIDVERLLDESGAERVSLLKMNIEGAEAVVFGEGSRSWIGRVDNIVVELHPDAKFGDAEEVFARAIKGEGFHLSKHGPFTLARRRRVTIAAS